MKFRTFFLVALPVTIILAGCAREEPPPRVPADPPAAGEGAAEEPTAREIFGAQTPFVTEVPFFPPFAPPETMLEVVEDRGDTVLVRHAMGETEIPKSPQRIYTDASILPTAILLDIPIIGTQYYPDMPSLPFWNEAVEGVEADPIGATGYAFNVERVLSLEPDLIIAFGNVHWNLLGPEQAYEHMSLIAPTIVLMDDAVSYYNRAALDIGRVLGVEDTVAIVEAANAEIIEACKPLQDAFGDESVILVNIWGGTPHLTGIVYNPDGKFVPVPDAYWLYGLCGIAPAASVSELLDPTNALIAHEGGIDLNGELLPLLRSDHIVITSLGEDNAERLALLETPLWRALPAVQNGNAYVAQYFSSYSHDTAVRAIRSVAEAVVNVE